MKLKLHSKQEAYTIIDDEDYDKVSKFKWYLSRYGYARTSAYIGTINGKEQRIEYRLHRFLLSAPKGKEVDHVNRDKLDNRKHNLRLSTRSQNMANTGLSVDNTTGFRGVSSHKNAWQASIRFNGKLIYLGRYTSPQKAAKAYNEKAKELFSDFAYINDQLGA